MTTTTHHGWAVGLASDTEDNNLRIFLCLDSEGILIPVREAEILARNLLLLIDDIKRMEKAT